MTGPGALVVSAVQRLLIPPAILLKRFTKNRWSVDGELIDRAAQWLLMVSNATGRSMPDMGPKGARRYYEQLCTLLETQPPNGVTTRDIALSTRAGTCPGRVYRPESAGSGTALPGLVYFHGGGHTIGSIESHDTFCRRLSVGAGCVVVSVDYRLAPEHRFPAALNDCYDSTVDVARRAEEFGIDPARLAVGGDSAGGNLTAAVSAMARDEGGPPLALQLLIYPGVGGSIHPGRQNPGLQKGFGLDAKTTSWFSANYAGEHAEDDPYLSPSYLPSHARLPPAILAIAHFDILRGEGLEYGDKLEAAGVPVTRLHYPDLLHGFVTMSVLPRASDAIREISKTLQHELSVR